MYQTTTATQDAINSQAHFPKNGPQIYILIKDTPQKQPNFCSKLPVYTEKGSRSAPDPLHFFGSCSQVALGVVFMGGLKV